VGQKWASQRKRGKPAKTNGAEQKSQSCSDEPRETVCWRVCVCGGGTSAVTQATNVCHCAAAAVWAPRHFLHLSRAAACGTVSGPKRETDTARDELGTEREKLRRVAVCVHRRATRTVVCRPVGSGGAGGGATGRGRPRSRDSALARRWRPARSSFWFGLPVGRLSRPFGLSWAPKRAQNGQDSAQIISGDEWGKWRAVVWLAADRWRHQRRRNGPAEMGARRWWWASI